jgi:hypothetical protein
MSGGGSWRIVLDGWVPTSLNELMGNRQKASRLKRKDAATILWGCVVAGVTPVGLTHAERRFRREFGVGPLPTDPRPRRRRVALEIRLGKGARTPDPDNLWKSTLDGLKRAGAIFEDSRGWCRYDSEILFTRGRDAWDRGTVIVLADDDGGDD